MAGATPGSQRRGGQPASQGRSRPSNGAARGQSRPKAPQIEVRLRILDGPGAGTEYAIAGSVVRLGRGEENDIPLDDNNASRVHAEVVRDNGGRYVVRDLGSRNGIYVNRKKVPQAALSNGDQITIGGTSVEFVTASAGGGAGVARPSSDGGTLQRWLVVAVIVGGLVFIVALISSHGSGNGGGSGSNTSYPTNVTQGPGNGSNLSYLLQSNPTPKAGVEVGRNTNTRTNQLPVAIPSGPRPADGQIQTIMNEGDRAYGSQQLPDARAFFARAVSLDPSCEGCRNKLAKVDAEIQREIESSTTAGIGYFTTERFEEAKRMFEKVKLLEPDPRGVNNANATRYIGLIDARIAEQGR